MIREEDLKPTLTEIWNNFGLSRTLEILAEIANDQISVVDEKSWSDVTKHEIKKELRKDRDCLKAFSENREFTHKPIK